LGDQHVDPASNQELNSPNGGQALSDIETLQSPQDMHLQTKVYQLLASPIELHISTKVLPLAKVCVGICSFLLVIIYV
jgi:hypothetical protein